MNQYPGFDTIATYLSRSIGLSVTTDNRPILIIRLKRLCDQLHLDLPELARQLPCNPGLREKVIDLATTHETRFFRELDTLQFICSSVRKSDPEGTGSFQFLSAGCATGQEVYSLRMLLADANTDARQFAIDGIDISGPCIQQARRAVYSKHSVQDVPEHYQGRFMSRNDAGSYVLNSIVTTGTAFFNRNLLNDPLPTLSYDMILCRNLLMYLTDQARHTVLNRMADALVPGGYLFLGKAESCQDAAVRFQKQQAGTVFYYQRKP